MMATHMKCFEITLITPTTPDLSSTPEAPIYFDTQISVCLEILCGMFVYGGIHCDVGSLYQRDSNLNGSSLKMT